MIDAPPPPLAHSHSRSDVTNNTAAIIEALSLPLAAIDETTHVVTTRLLPISLDNENGSRAFDSRRDRTMSDLSETVHLLAPPTKVAWVNVDEKNVDVV